MNKQERFLNELGFAYWLHKVQKLKFSSVKEHKQNIMLVHEHYDYVWPHPAQLERMVDDGDTDAIHNELANILLEINNQIFHPTNNIDIPYLRRIKNSLTMYCVFLCNAIEGSSYCREIFDANRELLAHLSNLSTSTKQVARWNDAVVKN